MRFGRESGLADLGTSESEVVNGWLAGSTVSELMETYLERVVGEHVYSFRTTVPSDDEAVQGAGKDASHGLP